MVLMLYRMWAIALTSGNTNLVLNHVQQDLHKTFDIYANIQTQEYDRFVSVNTEEVLLF